MKSMGDMANGTRGWSENYEAGTAKSLDIQGVEYKFRYCPAGTFTMGSPKSEKGRLNDETQREVTLTQGFWLLETEVTQAMWESAMGENPSAFSSGGSCSSDVIGMDTSNFPADSVSWEDCQKFIEKLNSGGCAPAGWTFRLPTEAEWEYACRAGTTTPFSWGETLNGSVANCDGTEPYGTSKTGEFLERTTEVGGYAPNAWGLRDMHGNVEEWCADWHGAYDASDRTDPTGPASGSNRVLRGGGWNSVAEDCRSACRSVDVPTARDFDGGVRIALGRVFSEESSPAASQSFALSETAGQNFPTASGDWSESFALSETPKQNWPTASGDWSESYEAGTSKSLDIQGLEYKFHYCPAGTFATGGPEDEEGRSDDETQREATLTNGFWILETEVTRAMWESATGTDPSENSSAKKIRGMDASNFPMECASWKDCRKFVKKLNSSGCAPKGWKFRLPTEAEWGYACRAGATTPFFRGMKLSGDKANRRGTELYGTSKAGEYLARTPEVGGCVPNAWGLRDMRGNAKEWCADKHVGYKASSGLRGGSRSGAAENRRLADRNDSDPAASDGAYGFRLVLDRVLPEESSPAASKKPGQNFSTASGNWSKNYKAGTSKSRNIGELEYKFRDYPAGTFMMESLKDDEDYDDEDYDDEESLTTRNR